METRKLEWPEYLAMDARQRNQLTDAEVVQAMVNEACRRVIRPLIDRLCGEVFEIKRRSLRRQAMGKGMPGWRSEFHRSQSFGFGRWLWKDGVAPNA